MKTLHGPPVRRNKAGTIANAAAYETVQMHP